MPNRAINRSGACTTSSYLRMNAAITAGWLSGLSQNQNSAAIRADLSNSFRSVPTRYTSSAVRDSHWSLSTAIRCDRPSAEHPLILGDGGQLPNPVVARHCRTASQGLDREPASATPAPKGLPGGFWDGTREPRRAREAEL